MRIIGCDLHARQQTIAMLDSDTGELEEKTLEHQGETVGKVLFRTVWFDSGGDRSDRLNAVVPGVDGRAGDPSGIISSYLSAREMVRRGVAVEKLVFSEKSRKTGDRKCLGKTRGNRL